MVEVMIVFVVLTVAMALFTSTVASTSRQRLAKRESVLAAEAGRRMLEVLRNEEFVGLFARYNASAADDPPLVTSPGPHFEVTGLTPADGDADGCVGEIVFPAPGPVLREDAVDPPLGLPRDLDGDDTIDAEDHASDYVVLPILVRLSWKSQAGTRTLEMYTLLADQ